MKVAVDNNIIDILLALDKNVSNYLEKNFELATHSKIFEETGACSDLSKRYKLLEMYPKFGIINVNDNRYPLRYPITYFSEEAWNMQRKFMENKKPTQNNYNDSLLILLQYSNQLGGVDSILVSQNKKDFQNFCNTNDIRYKLWEEFCKEYVLIKMP